MVQSKDKKEKKSKKDFWNYNYLYNSSIDSQIESIFSKYQENKSNAENNSKEVLIVHVKNKRSNLIDTIFEKVEDF